ncbi:MAG: virulence protein RhuM/Fic/DOC family protein [Patescibacteria group bacterium]|nr:virulence protein RhuM/Fic/DOC family protein [Patescibacteria group bacterium]
MKNNQQKQNILIYQTKTGAIEIRSDFKKSTIWASQLQIAEVFGVERSVVTKHIRNIFFDEELNKTSVCSKFAHTGKDAKVYQVQYYNLDIILAVGYRINSVRAIEFRKWATKTLGSYIKDGYAINKGRIAKNYKQFLQAVDDVKKLLPSGAPMDTASVLELINMFAGTWLSLDAYDKDSLATKGATKKEVFLSVGKLLNSLRKLKQILIERGEAGNIFGSEQRSGALAGIVGNVMQRFAGQELYGSVEEKAAHLLYFIVKDHPFVDGNKRSGAFSFAWFLRQAKILDKTKITPPALTALTILVAASKPEEKDKMIRLILTILK